MPFSFARCVFWEMMFAIRFSVDQPAIPQILDALSSVPAYRDQVQGLIVEQIFEGDAPNHYNTVTAEAESISDTWRVLNMLSPSLRSISLIRSSADPRHPALDSQRLLKGIVYPRLEAFTILGSPLTTSHFSIPLSAGFAPNLQRLELPSDMCTDRLAYAIPTAFPHLIEVYIHPLRPSYTIAQLDATLKIGEYLGVFGLDEGLYQDEKQAYCTLQRTIVVVAYIKTGDAHRVKEVQRFEKAARERVVPGKEGNFRLRVEGAEPSLEAMTRSAELRCLSLYPDAV